MIRAYYNDNDPYCAQWLRNLISQGLIADGDVDERPIEDVAPIDLAPYAQCHFFAGIGGWSRALRLASVPDNRPVWTGSCPCQPFSTAGRQGGFADERHLWPHWYWLISQCRPATIFGEQVAKAADWLALVRGDLEAVGYAVGCLPIEAASVGALHKRDRFWFVADTDRPELRDESGRRRRKNGTDSTLTGEHGAFRSMADTDGISGRRAPETGWEQEPEVIRRGEDVADAGGARLEASEQKVLCGAGRRLEGRAASERDWWAFEPDVGRVAHGVPARVAKLRAIGNAIVPQVAAEFIRAALP